MAATADTISSSLADLYIVRALDPLIDLARAISGDFVRRPQHHTGASAEETAVLTNFRLLYGKHPEWPDAPQRSYASAKPFARLGQSFAAARLAAIRYVQGASAPGAAIAQRLFTESADQLRAAAQPMEGASLSVVAHTHWALLQRAVSAVSSDRMAAAFGVTAMGSGEGSQRIYSAQLAYLCESMSQTLRLDRPLGQPLVSTLQRAAKYGSATIAALCAPEFDGADDDRLSEVIVSASTWATALGELALNLDVARAWSDPAYRSRLFPLERDMLPPHPAGEISLEGMLRTAAARFSSGSLGYSTHTVLGEVCCCTGDARNCGPQETYAIAMCPAETNGVCCPDTGTDDPTLTGILV
jgi:mersacidin/lichenicidin family type 2 lantibiotic